MASKKIITVFGSTGLQGGSVVNIFLNDPKLKNDWTVRAVTRDTTKDKAKKLESEGAQVVSADINDEKSLAKAMQGSTAVYALTNYWEKMDGPLEIKQGKALVDAAKEAGVKQFIWSSLFNISKLSHGKLPHVYHFDGKAEVEEYARSQGIPATFFMPGLYMSNIPGGMLRQTPPDNNWTLALPIPASTEMPVFDPVDTGKFVKAAVLHRDQLLGKHVLGATKYMTAQQLLDTFKQTFPEAGKTATYQQVPNEPFREGVKKSMGAPDKIAQELLENWLLLAECGYYGGASLDETHALVEDKLTTFEEHLKKNPKLPKDLK